MEIQDARLNTAVTVHRAHQSGKFLQICLSVFLISFIFLFLGMDRRIDSYDEGIVLTAAMRVAAGNIPHRDFYANYGPAQFYLVASLFHIFGQAMFVERLFDLFVKAGIVTICFGWIALYCRKWIALLTALVCGLWLFSVFTPASPTTPVILLSLIGSALIQPVFFKEISDGRIFAAGAISGFAALFRYDAGFALFVMHGCFIMTACYMRGANNIAMRIRKGFSILRRYATGTVVVFLPPASIYLAVAPIHPFIHDIILYPSKYYPRARNLPFPGIHLRSFEEVAVYLPVIVVCILLYSLVEQHHEQSTIVNQNVKGLLVLLGFLIPIFYCKGLVRISVGQMFLAITPSLIALAVLFEHISEYRKALRTAIIAVMVLSVTTASWSALKEIRRLYLGGSSVLADAFSHPGPASISNLTKWCNVPNPLHIGLCFLVDIDHIQAITFITDHTNTTDRLFVGVPRHDKIYANDNLTYFATQRMPATRWHHFDPDLQSRADVQSEMIREFNSTSLPYILIDSEFDSIHEPNDSSKSSGVTLLDDYIGKNYRPVKSFGEISVWQRNASH